MRWFFSNLPLYFSVIHDCSSNVALSALKIDPTFILMESINSLDYSVISPPPDTLDSVREQEVHSTAVPLNSVLREPEFHSTVEPSLNKNEVLKLRSIVTRLMRELEWEREKNIRNEKEIGRLKSQLTKTTLESLVGGCGSWSETAQVGRSDSVEIATGPNHSPTKMSELLNYALSELTICKQEMAVMNRRLLECVENGQSLDSVRESLPSENGEKANGDMSSSREESSADLDDSELSANSPELVDDDEEDWPDPPPGSSDFRICPVCSDQLPATIDQAEFESHVHEHFHDSESLPDDRRSASCPVCSVEFPLAMSQDVFESHVHGHFGVYPGKKK